MNPFTLIGFFLALFCATKYVNAVPVASDTSNLAVTAENLTTVRYNEEKLDNFVYNVDLINSSENESLNEPIAVQTTQKPQNETQKPKPKNRRRVKRRRTRTQPQPDCRTTTTEKSTTPKPTKLVILIPNLFISQSWGPGR